MGQKKRGIFFTIDAVIALIIIILSILVIYPTIRYTQHPNFIKADIIDVLSTLKVGEINNTEIKKLINDSKITDVDKSILEQIGEFYVTNLTLAKNLSEIVFSSLSTGDNIGIWYNNELMVSKNSSPIETAQNIEVDMQTITGVGDPNTLSLSAFSAKAYLTSVMQDKYFYLGGYVGDGNITIKVDYYGQINSSVLELAINNNFEVYVNGGHVKDCSKSPSNFIPNICIIPKDNFNSGTNYVELRGNYLHVAGGYLKISYQSDIQYEQPKKYYFPGIDGVINLYDGFYIPGHLQNLSIYLHFNSSYETFLTIGNVSVFNGSSGGLESVVVINDSYLSSILDYNSFSNKTIPLRLGLKEIIGEGEGGKADVILITDVSGSMRCNIATSEYVSGCENNANSTRSCDDPNLFNSDTEKLTLARCLDLNFTKTVLGSNGNRIGLVAFSQDANNYINLTDNQTLLENRIKSYTTSGGTCIACAINRAYKILKEQNGTNRKKFIIVMSDGVANKRATNNCVNLYGSGGIDETNIFAGGQNGIILKRENNGEWNKFTSPITNQINDIDLFNSTFGFGVGNSQNIIKWDGNSWSSASSPSGSYNINGIDFYNDTFALAVGNNGKVLKWDSTSWSSLVDIVNSPTLYSISFVNSSLVFIAGVRGNDGKIYMSLDGGSSWSENFSINNRDLRGIKMISQTKGYAVGENGVIISWNGNSWSSVSSPTSNDLYKIESYNSTEIFAVGGDSGQTRIIKNNGISWSTVYTNSISTDSLMDLVIFNNKVFSVGLSGTIVEYNGIGWYKNSNIKLAYFGNNTNGVTCNDDDNCNQEESFSSLNANYSSNRAYNELNSTIYSIGFGPVANCELANKTLKNVAQSGNGSFYSSDNATELSKFYSLISNEILSLSYSEQTSYISGGLHTKLYSDSYIEFNYTKKNIPYGLILNLEKKFYDNYSGNFSVPGSSNILEAQVVSYSGARWTSNVKMNGFEIYNLSRYGNNFVILGDPYMINLPNQYIQSDNYVDLTTGLSPTNTSQGSEYNKIIYKIIKNLASYSIIAPFSRGCEWEIEFEDRNISTFLIPPDYVGTNKCYYKEDKFNYDLSYSLDALKDAVWNLFHSLDFNNNGLIDIKFTEQNLEINSTEINQVPWHYAVEVQVRKWY